MTLAIRDPSIPDSPLGRWDGRWKLAGILLLAFATVSLLSPIAAGAALVLAGGLNLLGRVPVGVIAGRVALLVLAVLVFLVVVPLTHADGFWPGLAAAGVVAMRVIAVGLLALVLTRTAPLHHTLTAAYALYLPGVLVQVAQLAHRYTFVLAAEVRRLRVALRTRAFRLRTRVHTYRTLGHSIGSLLVRGSDHAERVSEAMRCRGFDGTYHTLTAFRTTSADVAGFLLVALTAAALVVADRVWLGAV